MSAPASTTAASTEPKADTGQIQDATESLGKVESMDGGFYNTAGGLIDALYYMLMFLTLPHSTFKLNSFLLTTLFRRLPAAVHGNGNGDGNSFPKKVSIRTQKR